MVKHCRDCYAYPYIVNNEMLLCLYCLYLFIIVLLIDPAGQILQ